MNIFSMNDHRAVIISAVKERKKFEKGFGFHALADAARIQRPYLSKALKGTAQLSPDQMFLIARFLKFTDEEQEFIQLLLERDRTAVAERKQVLSQKIVEISSRHMDSAAHLDARTIGADGAGSTDISQYYLEPILQILHVAISIAHFSKNPSSLVHDLHIPGVQLHSLLSALERMGLAERDGERLVPLEHSLHLVKSSPLYRAWRNQIKLMAINRLNQVAENDGYSFSSVFSADEPTRQKIHQKLLEVLKSSEELVKNAPSKRVYQLSFDLFPWTVAR